MLKTHLGKFQETEADKKFDDIANDLAPRKLLEKFLNHIQFSEQTEWDNEDATTTNPAITTLANQTQNLSLKEQSGRATEMTESLSFSSEGKKKKQL